MAEFTVDLQRREQYLKLARQWTEAATTLQALTNRRELQRLRAEDSLVRLETHWSCAGAERS